MDFNIIAPVSVEYSYDRAVSSKISIRSHTLEFSPQPHLSRTSDSSPQSVQVISSLIDSLSAIPAASLEQPEQLLAVEHHDNTSVQLPHRPASPTPLDADECLERGLTEPPGADDSSDGEVAAAPVIRYARRPPILPKRSSRSRLYSLNMASSVLAPRDSLQSLRSRAETDSVGIPSIERKHGSSASSTYSIISGLSGPRRRPTIESIRDKITGRPIPPKRLSSDRRRKTESLYSMDQEKENKYPTRGSSIDGYSLSGTPTELSNADSPTVAALSLLTRADLGNHLIPSRRSSLRRSVTGTSDTSPESHKHTVASRNLKDLKDLNIDSELIDGDDSTVRRIRELQEAREKRQREWRNEARKSERAAKRHTLATPKVSQRSSPYPSSRLSVAEVVVESPEVDSPLELSACVTAADLAGLPAMMPEPALEDSQSPRRKTPPNLQGSENAPPSRGNSIYRSPANQTKRNSAAPSISQDPSAADFKSISDEVDAFVSAPRFTQRIRHPRTGRTIAFSEVGDPNGFVVLCCVGMGLTRYLTGFYDELARTLRLRLITPDRPGVGESSSVPEASCTPLNWVDDVAAICQSLEITRFSLLAHSAGAIYALATALRMPQYVRGRIHLLAPWIPPSQMPKGAMDSQPVANLPFSHKILSVLPAQILKVANSRFLTATSASVDTKPLRTGKKQKHLEAFDAPLDDPFTDLPNSPSFANLTPGKGYERPQTAATTRSRSVSCYQANNETLGLQSTQVKSPVTESRRQGRQPASISRPMSPRLSAEARRALYNQALTHRIWALATQNANPAIDLVVCLERRKPIGFRYPEVTRSVVIHHGSKDTRVPVDNVKWLQRAMKRCELRILDGESHGLMASATAMATVLEEIAKEWQEWEKIARGKEKRRKDEAHPTTRRGRS